MARKSLTIRVQGGSALERLLSDPVAAFRGKTRRLHDMAERYEVLARGGIDDINDAVAAEHADRNAAR